MGPYFKQYWAISDDVGQYWTISSDIRVIFSSVKSVMCWVRSKSSRTGSINCKPNMVRPCRIRTVTISLKMTDIGRYRCIAIYIAHFWSPERDGGRRRTEKDGEGRIRSEKDGNPRVLYRIQRTSLSGTAVFPVLY